MSDIEELRQVVFSVKEPTHQSIYEAIIENFQGSSVYFRKLRRRFKDRNLEIYHAYNGSNMREVCMKFDLCKQQVLNIVNEESAKAQNDWVSVLKK